MSLIAWNTGNSQVADGYFMGWGDVVPNEYQSEHVIPFDATLQNLYIAASDPCDGTSFTVRVNGNNTALVATLDNSSIFANNIVNTVGVSAGDLVSVLINTIPSDHASVTVSLQLA